MTEPTDGTILRARMSRQDNREQARGRIDEIVQAMSTIAWSSAHRAELIKKWGCSESIFDRYAMAATYYLDRLDARERIIEKIQRKLEDWVDESGQDRVPSAKLLLESIGALRMKLDVTVTNDAPKMWRRVGEWLTEPTPDLIEKMHEFGWRRVEELEGKGEPSE